MVAEHDRRGSEEAELANVSGRNRAIGIELMVGGLTMRRVGGVSAMRCDTVNRRCASRSDRSTPPVVQSDVEILSSVSNRKADQL